MFGHVLISVKCNTVDRMKTKQSIIETTKTDGPIAGQRGNDDGHGKSAVQRFECVLALFIVVIPEYTSSMSHTCVCMVYATHTLFHLIEHIIQYIDEIRQIIPNTVVKKLKQMRGMDGHAHAPHSDTMSCQAQANPFRAHRWVSLAHSLFSEKIEMDTIVMCDMHCAKRAHSHTHARAISMFFGDKQFLLSPYKHHKQPAIGQATKTHGLTRAQTTQILATSQNI